MKKIFSIPLNVSLDEEKFSDFKSFLKKYNEFIFDVYFTCGLPPFSDDAYGGVAQSKSSGGINDIDSIISIQNECNVKVSATFNNIYIKPDTENLKLFSDNFAALYEKGVRSITLPFSSWVYSKEIKERYPGLFIKNTVMWKVHSAREFWNLAEVGFDYINLDRTLLRNYDALWEIHEARELFHKKNGKRILLSILANEYPCSGFCPFREEHSSLATNNSFGPYMFPSIFNICMYSHMKENQKNGIKMNFLKMAFVPPFEEEFNEISKVIDVYKMFGRIQGSYFKESLNDIENFAKGKGFLIKIREILETQNLNNNGSGNLINAWRKEIKNCNFNCWKCQLCDQLYDKFSKDNKQKLVQYKIY